MGLFIGGFESAEADFPPKTGSRMALASGGRLSSIWQLVTGNWKLHQE